MLRKGKNEGRGIKARPREVHWANKTAFNGHSLLFHCGGGGRACSDVSGDESSVHP